MREVDQLIEQVMACKIISQEQVRCLCRKVKALLFQQSNVQPVQAPVTICGDVHGQFWDVLELISKGGAVTEIRYVFLGDYVDRGYNSVETILLLFLLKLKCPEMVVLLRGNHQSRNITLLYGFYQEIGKKYGNYNVWYYFNDAFDYLPLAAIIQGDIFCVHGGLSPKSATIDTIRTLDRNAQLPTSGPICDLMWSDPEDEVQTWKQNSRGAGWLFGSKVVEEFQRANDVKTIVRSHQLVQQGYRWHFNQKLITVWSAPNYCYRMNNLAAILKLDSALEMEFTVFEASENNKYNVNYKSILPYFL